ncbi:hypothetical protein HNP21_006077 [Bacillus aryabhattai]|uniref:Uncharacterized protein n=1 Tax=Priestia aryabhattai TaxID=412384 RepID=A0A7W3NH59_PRIAR|nr:hypothetical protein [Priestia aryabhattai]
MAYKRATKVRYFSSNYDNNYGSGAKRLNHKI